MMYHTAMFERMEQMAHASVKAQFATDTTGNAHAVPDGFLPANEMFEQLLGDHGLGFSAEDFKEEFKDGCRSIEEFQTVRNNKLATKNPKAAKGTTIKSDMFAKTKLAPNEAKKNF